MLSDLDVRADFFPDARRRQQDMGPYFTNVDLDGFDLLRKIYGKGVVNRPVHAELLFTDPGKRQEGNILEVITGGIHFILSCGHRNHIVLGDHAPLGEPGGAGSVIDHSDIFRPDLFQQLLKQVRLLVMELAAAVLDALEV